MLMPDPTDSMDDGEQIAGLMQKFYPLLVEDAWQDAAAAGVNIAFDLANPYVQTVIETLAKQIRNVAETTRQDVRDLVAKSTAEGWSVEQLQRAIRDKGDIASRTRALTIARTETGSAYNLGAVAAYKAGGITHVDVLDGDEDEPCASANGARWTLEQAQAAPLGHPNCTRAFTPVVE